MTLIPTTLNNRWTLKLPEYRHKQWTHDWGETGWERTRLDSMHQHLEPGMLIYDIGAEEGDFPALWASWGCRVVLVEPVPAVWANTKAIYEANELPSPVACFQGFAGDDDAFQHIIRDGWPASAAGDLVANHGFYNIHERPEVQRIRIDTLALELDAPPDAITMDIEGAELIALRGAQATLCAAQPLLWISVHPFFMAEMYRCRVTDLWALLRECGYDFRLIDYDHELHVFAWVESKHGRRMP